MRNLLQCIIFLIVVPQCLGDYTNEVNQSPETIMKNDKRTSHYDDINEQKVNKKMKLSIREKQIVKDGKATIKPMSKGTKTSKNKKSSFSTFDTNGVFVDEIDVKNGGEEQDSRDLQIFLMSTPLLSFATAISIYFFLFGVIDFPPAPSVSPSMSIRPSPFTLNPTMSSNAPSVTPPLVTGFILWLWNTLSVFNVFFLSVANPIPTPEPTFSSMPSMKPSISNAPTTSERPSMIPSTSPTNDPTTSYRPSLSPSTTVEPSPQPQSQPV